MKPKTKKEIKSKVRIYHARGGNGYYIEIKDQYSTSRLAITERELEEIILYGQGILKNLLLKD